LVEPETNEHEIGEPVSCDRLAGDWRIWQLVHGHRFSADDLMTAWLAAEVAPGAERLLDLGAGIGSVGLMTLWRMSATARLTMVEAQDVSHALARRTIAENWLGGRVTPRLGDLRAPESVPERDHFDLVTGSPPYIPLGKGHVSPHPQRAACRMELRGTIADYAATAARAMRPDGWFVVCFAAGDPRAEEAVLSSGLHLRIRQDVVFRPGQAPTIALFACTRTPGACERRAPLHVRGPDRDWTEDYLRLRVAMGTEIDRSRVAGGR
jgi:tRNA1Val (adenine37-N6)-methyltransferase